MKNPRIVSADDRFDREARVYRRVVLAVIAGVVLLACLGVWVSTPPAGETLSRVAKFEVTVVVGVLLLAALVITAVFLPSRDDAADTVDRPDISREITRLRSGIADRDREIRRLRELPGARTDDA